MELDVITYIATTQKNPSGIETWASIIDYGVTQEYYSGVVNCACNNQTILQAILETVPRISLLEYSPTVFVVGSSYIVRTLTKLSEGVPLHRVQAKPMRNIDLWKEVQLKGVSWKSVSVDNLPGSREVVRLADSLLKREQNGN